MKQVFNLVKLFLVILLVSFTSCTNDLSEKDSQMSFSFTLPQEKLNRTTDDNNDKTLWNVTAVIENKKDIIQKIEQSGYSGETVTITFNQIIIGQKVRINIDLTQDGETTPSYTGSSDWLIVKKDENKINIALSKVEIILPVDAALPEIITSPESIVEIATSGSTETITKTLSVNATSTDGGTLSFIWQEKNDNNEWTPYTTTTNNDNTTCSIDVTVNKGQDRTFRCIITNTNNLVNGNTTATIETNEVTVAYVEGALTGITAQYKEGEYETFGSNFTYGNVTVKEIYTNASNDVPAYVTVKANDSRYTISPTKDAEKAIGYVPYTVKYNENNISTEIRVPVKYELKAEDFSITSSTNEIGNSTSSNPEKIAQFTGNTVLSVGPNGETSGVPSQIYPTDETATNSNYEIMTSGVQSVWTNTFNNSTTNNYTTVNNTTEGQYKYQATLTSYTDSWCVEGTIELEYYVQVCPWTIELQSEDDDNVVLTNLTGDTTYTLSATNEADTSSNVTWKSDNTSFTISNKQLITPTATTSDQTATITANVNNIEIGSVEVTVQKQEPLGSEGNPFTTWEQLKDYLYETTEDESTIYVKGEEIIADETATVNRPVTIIPDGDVTITLDANLSDTLFNVQADFTIRGNESANFIIDGDNNVIEGSLITTTNSNITLEYVTMKNYRNANSIGGGAIYLNSTSNKLTLNNCTFTNLLAYNGGAIYLETNGTDSTNNKNTITNCTFTSNTSSSNGSAIYLNKGHIILEGTTISNNNLYLDSVENTYCTFKDKNNLQCVDFKVSRGGGFSVITIDNTFDKSSEISINIVNKDYINSSSPLKFTNTNIGNDIINCFTITDGETSWTLNQDGTITEANAGGGGGSGNTLSGTTVTTFEALQNAVENGNDSVIIIGNNIALTNVINITREVTIAANSDVTLTQHTTDAKNLFWVKTGGNLTLGGGADTLTLTGTSSSTESILYVTNTGVLTITDNCVVTNCTNSTAANAIEVDGGTFNMTGGEITENTAGSAINAGTSAAITMNISGGKIYKNSGATNGGAINITNNKNYGTTVNIYGNVQIYNNTASSSGGGIYLTGSKCTLNVNSHTTEENKAAIYDNYIGTATQGASIYRNNSGTFNLNGNSTTGTYSENIKPE